MPSVVAGVVRDGALLWSAGRGRLPDGTTPDADVQYRIGSITKTFTAALVIRLRDDGLLRLDDTLEQYVPGTPLGGATLRDLLSHRAGLQAETSGPWWERTAGGAWPALAETLTAGTRALQPGERFHYSNLGFGVLGEVVARLRGRPWEACVAAELLRPLGMVRTTARPQPPAAPGLAVHPWADLVLPEPEHDAGAMAPAGQLWSTVTDLAMWATALLGDGGGVISAESAEELRTPVALEPDPDGWSGYGLGVQAWPDGMVGHGGSMPGFLAGLVGRPHGDAAMVMANGTTGLDRTLNRDLVAIVEEEEPRLPAEWVPGPPPDHDVLELLGPWYWGPAPLRAQGPWRGPAARRAWRRRPGVEVRARRRRLARPGRLLRRGAPASVRDPDGRVSHLDLATFILTREPYDATAPIPGDVDPEGWRPTS